jgi:hypothetical protein
LLQGEETTVQALREKGEGERRRWRWRDKRGMRVSTEEW